MVEPRGGVVAPLPRLSAAATAYVPGGAGGLVALRAAAAAAPDDVGAGLTPPLHEAGVAPDVRRVAQGESGATLVPVAAAALAAHDVAAVAEVAAAVGIPPLST